MRGRISKRARNYVRKRATAVMESVVRIERVEEPVFDEVSVRATSGSRTVIYEGPARIWTMNTGGAIVLGEDSLHTQTTVMSIPWDVKEIPRIKDQIEVLYSHVDEKIIGRRGHVTGTPKAGDLRPTRTFQVQFIEDDGEHEEG